MRFLALTFPHDFCFVNCALLYFERNKTVVRSVVLDYLISTYSLHGSYSVCALPVLSVARTVSAPVVPSLWHFILSLSSSHYLCVLCFKRKLKRFLFGVMACYVFLSSIYLYYMFSCIYRFILPCDDCFSVRSHSLPYLAAKLLASFSVGSQDVSS